jgi:hypothetical protein
MVLRKCGAIPGNFEKYTKEKSTYQIVCPQKGPTCECTQLSHTRQSRIHLHTLLYVKCETSALSTKLHDEIIEHVTNEMYCHSQLDIYYIYIYI